MQNDQTLETTSDRLRRLEREALAAIVTVESLAENENLSPALVALAVVIDRAGYLERQALQYESAALISDAQNLRQGVAFLAGAYDTIHENIRSGS